jgi:hypothetical protein
LRLFFVVISVLTQGGSSWPLFRGKSRAGSPAAQDPDGALELDPVRVDVRLGGGLAPA